jgi:hypothetical protein
MRITALKDYISNHPLLSVLIAASAVRLVAVIWSQGFIHSDDHFDTISVAWSWCQDGLWGVDGWLRWKQKLSDTIGRFPLYNLFILAQMQLCRWIGLTSLSDLMYVIRGSHALISLLPVWAAFKIVQTTTHSIRWAVAAGLVIAFHFAFPFLGVRNLIEVVGGSLWLVGVWYLCRFMDDRRSAWLYWAGFWAGLAWMTRFQIAFAVLPVPFLLWWGTRRLRPALHFSVAVGLMLLLSGLADRVILGRFAGSTITNLTMNTGLDALYHTIPLLYVALLLLLLVPPISVVLPFFAFRPGFVKTNAILFWTSISFVVFHSVHSNQQERFIFPIIPAFVVMGVLAVRYYTELRTPAQFPPWLRRTLWTSAGVNLVLLGFFTFAYGHRGMIEPLKWLESHAPSSKVVFIQPEVKRWVPIEYTGEGVRHEYVRSWSDLKHWPADSANPRDIDYFVIYPKATERLPEYIDSLSVRFGPLEPVLTIAPSYYDQVLYLLNRSHNDNYAAFIFQPRPSRDKKTDQSL